MPYSFLMYVPVRWLEYVWEAGYTRLVKAVWYAALGTTYLSGTLGAERIVMLICFIEACDLFFQQLEVGHARRAAKANRAAGAASDAAGFR